jgi:hypothetical protein
MKDYVNTLAKASHKSAQNRDGLLDKVMSNDSRSLFTELDLETPVLDEANHSYAFNSKVQILGIGQVSTFVLAKFAQTHVIQASLTVETRDVDRYRPLIQKILTSLNVPRPLELPGRVARPKQFRDFWMHLVAYTLIGCMLWCVRSIYGSLKNAYRRMLGS